MQKVTVNVAVCPMMKAPDHKSERVDEALYGMELRIMKQMNEDWLYVLTDYAYEGYVRAEDVFFDGYEGGKQTVMIHAADILTEPETKAPVMLTVPMGAVVTDTGPSQNHYREILLADGRTGYIREKALGQDSGTATGYDGSDLRQALAETAAGYMDVQYRWGGKSPWGIDCSGLCFMAYRLNGITIFRDASIHPDFPVKEISLETLDKGDLLFFPGHVAMYITDGLFIHSSVANGGVAYNSLDPSSPLYLKHLHQNIRCAGSVLS